MWGLSWVNTSCVDLPAHQSNLRSLFGGLYRPAGLNTTSLSQACILGAVSRSGEGKQNVHSKDHGGDEGPQIAGVQLMNEAVVISSQWPPPTPSIHLIYIFNIYQKLSMHRFFFFNLQTANQTFYLFSITESNGANFLPGSCHGQNFWLVSGHKGQIDRTRAVWWES